MPRKKKDDEFELLNRQQVARLFRISTRTLTRHVQARLLPPPLPGGVHYWSRGVLKAYLDQSDAQAAATRDKATRKKRTAKRKAARRQDSKTKRVPGSAGYRRNPAILRALKQYDSEKG
jgi:hypothetical protein